MNRAPVALFALLCTLASSMVAADVANDRTVAAATQSFRAGPSPELKTISFTGSVPEKWLTERNWQAIDINRAVALPTKKMPVRTPEKAKVAAVIITIEQPQAPAVKPQAKPAQPTVAAKPFAKPAAKVAPAKAVVATKPAVIQPRVTSQTATRFIPKSTVGSVLSAHQITLADLHLCKPAVATTNGSVTALPVQGLTKVGGRGSMVSLGGEKLQVAYGSLSLITVGGSSFTASPYITDSAASILPNKVVGSSKPEVKVVKAPVRSSASNFDLNAIYTVAIRTGANVAEHLGRQVNRVVENSIAQVGSSYIVRWIPFLGESNAPTIQSAQLKGGVKAAVKK